MELAIAVTLLCSLLLILIGTFRGNTNHLLIFVVILSVTVFQWAHEILFRSAEFNADYKLLLNASIANLYAPVLLYFANQKYRRFFIGNVVIPGLIGMSIAVYAITVLLYPMWLYCLSGLFNAIVFVVLAMVIAKVGVQKDPSSSAYSRIRRDMMATLLVLMLLPFAIPLCTYFFPSDNFWLPYTPLLSTGEVANICVLIALVIFLGRFLAYRKLYQNEMDSAPSSSMMM
jgi:hypothetical protein